MRNHTLRSLATITSLALLASGCTTRYQAPSDTTSSVPIVFVDQGPGSIIRILNTNDANDCSMDKGGGSLGAAGKLKLSISADHEKHSRLRHSQPITIAMGWWDVAPIREYGEKVTFTPNAKFEYQLEYISQSTSAHGLANVSECSIAVRERPIGDTGEF
jgi:hypothetical protein